MESISKIMSRSVGVVSPGSTIREAAEQMRVLNVGAVPVCEGQKLLGMITDRDIALRAVASGRDPLQTRVSDVMSGNLIWCSEEASVAEVAETMAAHQIRRIPILDQEQNLVGIVALADLANSQQDPGLKADALEGISEDSGRARS